MSVLVSPLGETAANLSIFAMTITWRWRPVTIERAWTSLRSRMEVQVSAIEARVAARPTLLALLCLMDGCIGSSISHSNGLSYFASELCFTLLLVT